MNQNFKIIFMGKDLQVENTYFVSGAKRGLSNQFQPEVAQDEGKFLYTSARWGGNKEASCGILGKNHTITQTRR